MHKGINTKRVSSSKAALKKTLDSKETQHFQPLPGYLNHEKVGNPENSPVAGWWLNRSTNPFEKNMKKVIIGSSPPSRGELFTPTFHFFPRWKWPVLRNYEPPFDPLIKPYLYKAIFFSQETWHWGGILAPLDSGDLKLNTPKKKDVHLYFIHII